MVPRFAVRDRDATLLRIDFSGLPTRYPYTLMAPQNVTEDLLESGLGTPRRRRAARAHDGEDRRDRRAGVRAQIGGPTGPLEIAADYVVGADGMHSPVRELSGIGFTGPAYPQSFVLADVEMDWPLPRDEVQLFFSPGGLVVVAPLPGGRHRVVATVDDAPEHPTADDVAALLAARGPRTPGAVASLAWSSRFRVHHRLADHYRHGPVFLAGDAAHVHSPAGGQGMNTGIQDAVDLGTRFSQVLGGADPALLDGYERDRRPVARRVVALTDRMTRAATLSGPAARVRNTVLRGLGALPPVRHAAAMNLSELGRRPPAREHSMRLYRISAHERGAHLIPAARVSPACGSMTRNAPVAATRS